MRMAWGRKTGGRKKGTPNKRTSVLATKTEAAVAGSEGEMPLDYMIRVMRDPTTEPHPLTLDIDAENTDGFPEHIESVVRDNAASLRITDFGFEGEWTLCREWRCRAMKNRAGLNGGLTAADMDHAFMRSCSYVLMFLCSYALMLSCWSTVTHEMEAGARPFARRRCRSS